LAELLRISGDRSDATPWRLARDENLAMQMSQPPRFALGNDVADGRCCQLSFIEGEETDMRSVFALMICAVSAGICSAAEVERSYFVGEVKLSSESGQPLGSQAMLAERTYDPDHNVINERAVVVQADGTVNDYPMRMIVKGDSFTLDDPKKFVEGSGTLFGPAWHWTYFKGSYKAKNGAQIEDQGFVAAPDIGVARKTISGPDGKVIMIMDVALKSTSKEAYDILTADLLKKTGSASK
jgi:hypothetical protein